LDFFLRKPSLDAREVDFRGFCSWSFVAAWGRPGLLLTLALLTQLTF
jgi:hypothetical protein